MASILFKSVLLNERRVDILVEGNLFRKIAPANSLKPFDDTQIIDGNGFAIFPGFFNAHSHSPMVFGRGLADDVALSTWLSDYIWPREAKLSEEDVYVASRFAILEMIRTGTVFFADMYWHRDATIRAAREMGIRASIGVTFADSLKKDTEANVRYLYENVDKVNGRVSLAVATHSIYTASKKCLRQTASLAEELNLPFHIHVAETVNEVAQSVDSTDGKSPVEYLHSLGCLSHRTIAAHLVHVSEQDLRLLKEDDVVCVHNPCSNMKLSSGTFRMKPFLDHHIRMALGTDGAASNNNLDMREEMKFASLLAKMTSGDPRTLSADEVLRIATKNGAEAFGIPSGEIAEGKLSDAILVNLDDPVFATGNISSDFVYAANPGVIDSVLCDGKFLMRHGKIDGAEEIEADFRRQFPR